MKNNTPMRPLTPAELTAVNGGSNANGASMSINTGTDSLLSMEFKWQQGDNYKDYKLEAGKGITVNLDAFINGLHV